MTHDLSVLFPKHFNIQQTLRKNFILELWSFSILILYLKRHENADNFSLYTPNINYKIFDQIPLKELSTDLIEIIKNLNSVLIYKIELLLSRAETFYWQKSKYLSRIKRILSKKKSNYLLSVEKRNEDKVKHHLQQINQLLNSVIRGLFKILESLCFKYLLVKT